MKKIEKITQMTTLRKNFFLLLVEVIVVANMYDAITKEKRLLQKDMEIYGYKAL